MFAENTCSSLSASQDVVFEDDCGGGDYVLESLMVTMLLMVMAMAMTRVMVMVMVMVMMTMMMMMMMTMPDPPTSL